MMKLTIFQFEVTDVKVRHLTVILMFKQEILKNLQAADSLSAPPPLPFS